MNVTDLVASSDPLIASTAKLAVSYKDSLDKKLMTQEEYDDLMDDLVDLKRIDGYALSIERQVLVQKAFDIIKAFAGLII
jgi:hypothetical protein